MKGLIRIVISSAFVIVAVESASIGGRDTTLQAQQVHAREVPAFQVDPSWPKIPNHWVFGEVSSVFVDPHDHVWVLQRPGDVNGHATRTAEDKANAAPPVLEFDANGNFIQGWGGPGKGYEWPEREHGITVDYKGNVWIGGNGPDDHQIVKMTNTGKFIMQIGHSGQSKGNTDTVNVNKPADVSVYPKTNEVFVADGYGNRRVIVFDADTGAFKRMWGAYGHKPTDPPPTAKSVGGGEDGGGAPALGPDDPNFRNVHCARISNDGLVYVCDRFNGRVQVFTPDGEYLKQLLISPDFKGPTATRVAFSKDPEQKVLFVGDRSKQQIVAFDRKTFEMISSFGGPGCPGKRGQPSGCEVEPPGTFGILHDLAADSQGNIYTAEVNEGRRAQKFTFKGMAPAPEN